MTDATIGAISFQFKADVGDMKARLAEMKAGIKDASDNIRSKMSEASQAFLNFGRATEQTSAKIRQYGETIGNAAYEFGPWTGAHVQAAQVVGTRLVEALAKANLAVKALGIAMTGAGVAAAAMGAMVIGSRESIKELGELEQTAKLAGVSLRELQNFQRAAILSGGTRDGMATALQGIAKAANDASRDENEFSKILAANGVKLKDNQGNLRSTMSLLRAFVAKLPPGERGAVLTQGGYLSANGVNRIKAALVARAFDDPGVVARAFDHPDSNIKSIASALVDAAPDWIAMPEAVTRGEIPAAQDITPDIMQAVKTIMRARDEGEPVGKLLAQGDMFHSDVGQLAARLFFKDGAMKRFLSKSAMGENLTGFARELLDGASKGVDMFGNAPASAKEVASAVVRKSDAREAAIAQIKRDPKAIDMAFDDPKVQEAAFADLERNIAQGKNRVESLDADGNAIVGFADGELLEIENELALAKELAARNVPMSALAAE